MKMYRKACWLSGLAMLMMSGFACAQAPSAPATPPTPVTPTAPAPVVVTPEMRSAIKELLEVSRFRDSLIQAYQGFGQSLPGQMAQSLNAAIQQNQKLSDEQKKKVRERLNKSFDAAVKSGIAVLQDPKLVDEMMDKVYPIYAKHFSLAEIRQITAFYKSPVGAKSITTMPIVVSDTMRTAMTLVQPRLVPIVDNLLKKEIEAVQQEK